MTRRAAPLHLLEFGIRWPPECFIRARLEQLAASGITITVATTSSCDHASLPRGIEVRQIVTAGRSGWQCWVTGLWSLALLILARPRRAIAVIASAGRPTAAGRAIGARERRLRLLAYARLARLRVDVVHFEWMTVAVDYVSLADALGAPAVMSCRGEPDLYRIVPSRLEIGRGLSHAFDRMAAVHCVAEAVKRQALASGLDPDKATVILRGVDLDLFSPPGTRRPAPDRFVVLCIGHLRWLKAQEYAVLVLRDLVSAGVPATLEIIGTDPVPELEESSQRQRILRSAAQLDLADRVKLRGQLAPEQVAACMQRADALLHPSASEGLPGVVLEAMACGLPVVATDVGGTGEALTDGVEGFLVRPRDYRAAARALATLWHAPELRSQMAAAGRARAESQFALERQTDQWCALYRLLTS